VTTEEFVREALPPPPARVLEIGCGATGALALALSAAGWDVLAIDPQAPQGEIFRPLALDDLDPNDGPFEAVVASRSLHHIHDLGRAFDRIRSLLAPGGVLAVEEFAWELADGATLAWLDEQHGRRRTAEKARAHWEDGHRGLHGGEGLRAALAAAFRERSFGRVPALYRDLPDAGAGERERRAIEAGAIPALGFRWTGTNERG
jgi:SAM-dependent methyltransferase